MKTINIKKIFFLGFFISISSCKAQILPLNTNMKDIPINAHVKDNNNELSPYIGTYVANFQDKQITIYITKEEDKPTKRLQKNFYRDALIIKYIVKNSNGSILQDTKNTTSNIELYSYYTYPTKNIVVFYYSGTNCGVGWGDIYLKKLNATQISWEYRPDDIILDDAKCPPGTDIDIYLPETKDLIFTKQ